MENQGFVYNQQPLSTITTTTVTMDNGSGMAIAAPPGAQIHVIPRPDPIPGVPIGLEYLTRLNKVVIKQKLELLEILSGFEQKNKYVLSNANGDQAYFAYEDSDCLTRQCCANQRDFKLHIIDNFRQEVITVDRPFVCCGDSCYGLFAGCGGECAQRCSIFTKQGPLAQVKQRYNGCSPKYEVKGSNNEFDFVITGENCMALTYGCHDKEFEIKTADGHHVGFIKKTWRGFLKETYTDSDCFTVEFPMDLAVKAKAALLGVTFLIDFMYFENKQNNSSSSC